MENSNDVRTTQCHDVVFKTLIDSGGHRHIDGASANSKAPEALLADVILEEIQGEPVSYDVFAIQFLDAIEVLGFLEIITAVNDRCIETVRGEVVAEVVLNKILAAAEHWKDEYHGIALLLLLVVINGNRTEFGG